MHSTWVVKECGQAGGVRKSNGRQVIIPGLRQCRSWWLEGRPFRRWPEESQFPLSMQAPLHTVTKRTCSNVLSVRSQTKLFKKINVEIQFLVLHEQLCGMKTTRERKKYPLEAEWKTYTGVLEEAAVAPDTSSAAGRALDSSSEETSCFEGALSSAVKWREKRKKSL